MSEIAPEKPKCRLCHSEIPDANAKICPVCKSPQIFIECRICRRAIPGKATYCNECKSYQGTVLRWIPRSLIGLSLLTTLVAVISPAVTAFDWYRHYDSKTRATLFTPPDMTKISLYVWNSGRNPSAVLHCRLHYTDSANDDVELIPSDSEKTLIKANGQSILQVQIPAYLPKKPLGKGPTQVLMDVQESNNDTCTLSLNLPAYFTTALRGRFGSGGS